MTMLHANMDWKYAFLMGVGQFRPNFYVEGDAPTNRYVLSYELCLKAVHV